MSRPRVSVAGRRPSCCLIGRAHLGACLVGTDARYLGAVDSGGGAVTWPDRLAVRLAEWSLTRRMGGGGVTDWHGGRR